MLGKLSVALLLIASPALANEPAETPAQEYTIKKVCRTYEVAGSAIPRQSCVKKKVPIKKPATESEEATSTGNGGGTQNESMKTPEEQ
jgi:hypothetical protein